MRLRFELGTIAILLVCCSPGPRPDPADLMVKLEVGTRAEVEWAIKQLGLQAHKPAVEGLARRLKDDNPQLRKLAADALRRIGTQDAILALLDARQIAMILKLRGRARRVIRRMPPSPERTELL